MACYERAFVEAGAVQCGFCTPGMVLAAKALLDANPAPGEAEVRAGLRRNLCRCTGYVKIVDAVLLAGRYRGDPAAMAAAAPAAGRIGTRLPRVDAQPKIRGRGAVRR